mmetsp:Transcript_865/g.1891  ORF Transcript_865/g.1891 Transcript_865/m.1891 type:complete len:222 (-) Transcript_865:97-762(-)|eukprot:753164-Hanusia_phi.AAC.2
MAGLTSDDQLNRKRAREKEASSVELKHMTSVHFDSCIIKDSDIPFRRYTMDSCNSLCEHMVSSSPRMTCIYTGHEDCLASLESTTRSAGLDSFENSDMAKLAKDRWYRHPFWTDSVNSTVSMLDQKNRTPSTSFSRHSLNDSMDSINGAQWMSSWPMLTARDHQHTSNLARQVKSFTPGTCLFIDGLRLSKRKKVEGGDDDSELTLGPGKPKLQTYVCDTV